MKKSLTFLLPLLILSCSGPSKKDNATSIESQDSSEPKRVVSFLGKKLPPKEFPDSIRLKLEKKEASARYVEYPDSVELAIWEGRRMAYLGRYFESIELYSAAIEKFPNDHRLYRHRGHRYITTRQLDKAIADFEKATELAEQVPNRIEPDGIPNKLNMPLGNDRFNIYYHHALALYLKRDFEKAIPIYEKCMAVSDNNDLLVATSYWLYMTLHRIGQEDKARELVQSINKNIEIIENPAYRDLIATFKGEMSEEEIAALPNHPTYLYGLGMHYWMNEDEDGGEDLWAKALKHQAWDAFGYISAESEMRE